MYGSRMYKERDLPWMPPRPTDPVDSLPFGNTLCNHAKAVLSGLGPRAADELSNLLDGKNKDGHLTWQLDGMRVFIGALGYGPRTGRYVKLRVVLLFGERVIPEYAMGRFTIAASIPDSVAIAAQGRPLRHLLATPKAFAGADARILRVDQRLYASTILLAHRRTTISLNEIANRSP